jgi:ATP-binding cassette subfamily B (MDR/TAP) protein 1
LNKGYETTVGESGIKLSGGQRQRLAIARSIVKQPKILILDEATSAIDVRTERIVQAALDRVSKNRTTIVIAHRLSTIKKANKIIVMRQGKLVEEGTHDQLLEIEDGVYHGLVRAQAISMGTDSLTDDTIVLDEEIPEQDEKKSKIVDATVQSVTRESSEVERGYKVTGFIRSFGRLMYEQRTHWILYTLILLSAAGGGGEFYPCYIVEHYANRAHSCVSDSGSYCSTLNNLPS